MGEQALLKPALYGEARSGDVPVLHAGKCACGAVFFPMQSYGCDVCGRHGDDLSSVDLEGRGELIAAVVVHLHAPRPGAPSRKAPFVIGAIQLDGGPTVRTLLGGTEAPAPGTRMVATLAPVEEAETPTLDLRFVPAA